MVPSRRTRSICSSRSSSKSDHRARSSPRMTQTACTASPQQRMVPATNRRDAHTMQSIRVLIVDDHRSFAEAIAMWLGAEPDVVLVGTLVSLDDAEATIKVLRPDVLVLDVEVSQENSLPL